MPGTSTLIASSKRLPKRRFTSATEVSSRIQTPDRSGLPSGARGVGAVRFGLPSGVRGVPGVGKFTHLHSRSAGEERDETTTLQCGIWNLPDSNATLAVE